MLAGPIVMPRAAATWSHACTQTERSTHSSFSICHTRHARGRRNGDNPVGGGTEITPQLKSVQVTQHSIKAVRPWRMHVIAHFGALQHALVHHPPKHT